MYKIMSNHCTYPEIHYEALEPAILVEEDVAWENHESDNVEEQEIIDYAETTNSTLTENANESYVTAVSDTTQYFSVLDSSNQTILNDISDGTINNSTIQETSVDEEHQETNSIDVNNGQVVLFKVDGSDDLYGFQLTHDEEGNLQKYQFKVRQNLEGNLEAIPETLQILPVDNFVNADTAGETEQPQEVHTFQDTDNFEHIQEGNRINIKQEQNLVSEDHSSSEFNQEEIFEEQLDTKEGILELSAPAPIQKQELHEEITRNGETQEYDENSPSLVDGHEHGEEVFYTPEDPVRAENFSYHDPVEEDSVEDEAATTAEHYEELFVKESHLMDDTNGVSGENGLEEADTLNESDNEEYETVEGDHITGDTEEAIYENSDIRKSPSYQASTIASRKKIIRNVIRKVRIQKNDGKTNLYYLVKNTEKENMGQAPSNSIMVRPNPRSILKCSVAAIEPQKFEEEEEKYDKRFAKSKEAQQARMFHNFIAQTKIIHAPIRQGRLPRKQEIKPMKRTDEEIVVQEVVVSSNGFIETSEEGILKERVPLKPTEYIQLSDSDEDFDPKAPHKRKKKSRKRKPMVEITISDSEEDSSDKSVGEADEENIDSTMAVVPVKRPRGRPPKNHDKDEEKEVVKRPRGRPPKYPKPQTNIPEEEIIVIKIDNKCPHCPKSFPSEGSLRYHMQYHKFSEYTSSDVKYMCEKCGDTFKNSFLLNRHMDSYKTSNIICGICKKVFNDQAQLLNHKKTHIKQQMLKTTTLLKDSPKISRFSKNICEDCGKNFSNVSALNIHKKQHKRYFCQSCKMSFTSHLTLGNHLRKDCVKRLKSPRKQRDSKIEKRLPPKQSAISQPKNPEIILSRPLPSNTKVVTNIKCDSCSMTFATYTSLFKHKVLKHGLDSPDKTTTREPTRKSLYKSRAAHSGVRPSTGLKNAFIGLQNKLEAFKNSHKKI